MGAHAKAIEKNIDALEQSGFFENYNIRFSVSDIDEVPYTEFAELQFDLFNGDSIVRVAPFGLRYSYGVFSIFASPSQRRFSFMTSLLGFVVPVLGIGLTIFADGWWWLLLLSAPLIVIKITKSIFLKVLFEGISISEKAFCFAFCGSTITLETPDGKIHHRIEY